jgi:uncharacterized BrkB/YihY/UPF0761 family membrane protein
MDDRATETTGVEAEGTPAAAHTPVAEHLSDDLDAVSLAAALDELSARPVRDTRASRTVARGVELLRRAVSWGPFGRVAEIGWLVGRRDASIAGSVLAAAIAYRIFIFFLPLGFFLVAALGTYADASATEPSEVLETAGIVGYFADSIADASGAITGLSRAIALVVSGALVLYEAYMLLRVVRVVSALAWRVHPPALTRPLAPTSAFLGLTAAAVVAAQAMSPLRATVGDTTGLALGLLLLLVLPAYWLAMSAWLLPHAAPRWVDLVPGSLLFGAGFAALHVFYTLILFPWLDRKEEAYGVLGVAAGLLFGFFLTGRTMELSASLNAVLAERRPRG